MLPQLRELHHEFGEAVEFIGVHSAKFPAEREDANLRKAVLRNEIAHPVINDGAFAVWQSYAVRAWPTLMVIDPLGRVVAKHEGEFELEAIRDFLARMIAAFETDGSLVRRSTPETPELETTAGLRFPGKVLFDRASDRLFIADSGNHRIVVTNTSGVVQATIGGRRGFTDGTLAEARFVDPQGLAIDESGRTLYVADRGNHAIRAIDVQEGRVATVAGTGRRARSFERGPGREVDLASPWDLAWLDGQLWIAMAGTHQLWTFDPASGMVAPAAGSGHESIHDGPLISATFAQPSGLTAAEGLLFVADSETSAIRRVDRESDRVRRLVGRGLFEFGDVDAMGDSVRLQHPLGVSAVVENGEIAVYLADTYNDKIKRLNPATREVTTIFGGAGRGLRDGSWDDAELWEPGGLHVSGRTVYIADTNNHAIRVADLGSGAVSTFELHGLPA
jgi:DNA-binding beta-propeller fold protein YncE